jgi:ankyrin repeat protein
LAELDVGLLFYLVFGLLAVIVTWINKRKEAWINKRKEAADKALLKVLSKPAWKGNIEAVKQHLAAGADVNAKGDYGWIPLHYAAVSGRKEVAELLITGGADVNAKDEDGETPLDMAIRLKQTETADLIRKHGGKTGKELKSAPQRKTSTALKAASSKKSKSPIPKWAIAAVGGVTMMALVMYFLSGPSVDIWEAARTGNIEAVKQHLAAGSDVNAKDEAGWTLLHEVGTKEVAELLIAEGADVNAMNMWGGTPLQLAAREGRKEIAELLIENEADLNVKDKGGLTSLDWAIYYHHPETTDLLRKHGGKTGAELL